MVDSTKNLLKDAVMPEKRLQCLKQTPKIRSERAMLGEIGWFDKCERVSMVVLGAQSIM